MYGTDKNVTNMVNSYIGMFSHHKSNKIKKQIMDKTTKLKEYGNFIGLYENGLSFNDWRWAGLIIYQPYSNDSGTDSGLSGDLTAMKTWKFNFKNCKYNGVKVNANNFGQHNQVFYLYCVGTSGSIKDASAEGLVLNFN